MAFPRILETGNGLRSRVPRLLRVSHLQLPTPFAALPAGAVGAVCLHISRIRISLRWFVPAVPILEFTGTLDARVQTVISARIRERLAEVLVDQGDPVQADQLVARQVAVAETSLAATRTTASIISFILRPSYASCSAG